MVCVERKDGIRPAREKKPRAGTLLSAALFVSGKCEIDSIFSYSCFMLFFVAKLTPPPDTVYRPGDRVTAG